LANGSVFVFCRLVGVESSSYYGGRAKWESNPPPHVMEHADGIAIGFKQKLIVDIVGMGNDTKTGFDCYTQQWSWGVLVAHDAVIDNHGAHGPRHLDNQTGECGRVRSARGKIHEYDMSKLDFKNDSTACSSCSWYVDCQKSESVKYVCNGYFLLTLIESSELETTTIEDMLYTILYHDKI
jgi:hypothetical protein